MNKVATAVQLQFDVRGSPSLPDDVRERLLRIAGSRLSSGGVLTIEARRFRTQEQNRLDGRKRLAELVRRAAEADRERCPTKPTASSQTRRVEKKRRRGETKRARRTPPGLAD